MRIIKYVKSFILTVVIACVFTTSNVFTGKVVAQPVAAPVDQQQAQSQLQVAIRVTPMLVVNSPKSYLNKNIIMNAKFDKFSTLGLDYKPAFKSSEDYIGFLVKRDDTTYTIPLSEMKLFLKRDVAEKFIELKTDDEIEIKGLVFSDALGDAWVDVKELKIIQKAPDEKDK